MTSAQATELGLPALAGKMAAGQRQSQVGEIAGSHIGYTGAQERAQGAISWRIFAGIAHAGYAGTSTERSVGGIGGGGGGFAGIAKTTLATPAQSAQGPLKPSAGQ